MRELLLSFFIVLTVSSLAMAAPGSGTHEDPIFQNGIYLEYPVQNTNYPGDLTCFSNHLIFVAKNHDASINIDGDVQGMTFPANVSISTLGGLRQITLTDGDQSKTFTLSLNGGLDGDYHKKMAKSHCTLGL